MTEKCNKCGGRWYESGVDLVYDEDDEYGMICENCLEDKLEEEDAEDNV